MQETPHEMIERWIREAKAAPRFRGQTQVIRALRRIQNLAALN